MSASKSTKPTKGTQVRVRVTDLERASALARAGAVKPLRGRVGIHTVLCAAIERGLLELEQELAARDDGKAA